MNYSSKPFEVIGSFYCCYNELVFFLTLHISTLWLSCPQFVQCLPVLPSSIFVFIVAVDLEIYGTNSAFWASTCVIPSSYSKITSLCNCNMVCFILVVAIFKQDNNPTQNIVVKKLSLVGVCNPWASFCMCSSYTSTHSVFPSLIFLSSMYIWSSWVKAH
jgi:hypothetical protein